MMKLLTFNELNLILRSISNHVFNILNDSTRITMLAKFTYKVFTLTWISPYLLSIFFFLFVLSIFIGKRVKEGEVVRYLMLLSSLSSNVVPNTFG